MREKSLKSKIVFLSDSRKSPTNIPYRIKNSLLLYRKDLEIYFISLTTKDLFKLLKLIIKNQFLIIHSHHLKSLTINIIIKIISKIIKKRIFSYHTFHCELKRYSKYKLILIYLSKFIIGEFSCVSNNLKINWECFLKKKVNFLPIGISNMDRDKILRKSKDINKNIKSSNIKNNVIKITWIGRFEKVKNPLLFLKSLRKLDTESNYKFEIIFAGEGKLVPIFKKELKKFLNLKLPNIDVQYMGMIEREEVINLISTTNIYVNTSNSESFCVCANEFLYNPFCKIILPEIKNLKEIYECKRVDFYKVNDEKSLSNSILKNAEYFFKKSSYSYENIYPNNFQKYRLEETAKKLLMSYMYKNKNYKN